MEKGDKIMGSQVIVEHTSSPNTQRQANLCEWSPF